MKVLKASKFNSEDKGFLFHCSLLEATVLLTLVEHSPATILQLPSMPLENNIIHNMYLAMRYSGIKTCPDYLLSISPTEAGKEFNVKEFVNEVY